IPFKPSKPLQATVEHNEHYKQPRTKNMMGKLRGGAMTDSSSLLKSRLNTSNSGKFNVEATSSFGIIGVKFVISIGQPPLINRVFAGTPAAKVGLAQNDVIVAVDGVPTYG